VEVDVAVRNSGSLQMGKLPLKFLNVDTSKIWMIISIVCILGLLRIYFFVEEKKAISTLGEEVASQVSINGYWRVGDDFVCRVQSDSINAYDLISARFNLKHSGGNICDQARIILELATGIPKSNQGICVSGLHPSGGMLVLFKINGEVYAVRIYM
jgi:hypothetical protein